MWKWHYSHVKLSLPFADFKSIFHFLIIYTYPVSHLQLERVEGVLPIAVSGSETDSSRVSPCRGVPCHLSEVVPQVRSISGHWGLAQAIHVNGSHSNRSNSAKETLKSPQKTNNIQIKSTYSKHNNLQINTRVQNEALCKQKEKKLC